MKILVMGLPGSGKTSFAKKLMAELQFSPLEFKFNHICWLNADEVRKEANDWDFSYEGRTRQAERMRDKANFAVKMQNIVVADFICPTNEARSAFKADLIVLMDTISEGRFEDTNIMFDKNCNPDYTVTDFNQEGEVIEQILHKLHTMGF